PAAVRPAEKRDVLAALALLAPQPREPRVDAELAKRAAHRLDLVLFVIGFDARKPLQPTLAVARFLPRGRQRRAVHVQVDAEAVDELVDEAIRLREQVAGVDQDD